MDADKLRELLEAVRRGARPVEEALAELKDLPYAELGYATVDHHRAIRVGAPEVVFGQAKTAAQIAGIAKELVRTGENVLVTRLEADKAAAVGKELPTLRYHELARVGTIEQKPIPALGKS